MDLDIICAEYLKYSKHFKSWNTFKRYDTPHLNIIINFMITNEYSNSDNLDYDSIYDFIDYSKLRDNTNKTINKRIQLLNRAITFQVKQGKCKPTIISSFPKLKELDKRFDIVDEQTMKRVINFLLDKPDTFMNIRNRVILFLFIDTGARLSEVTNIKIKNINSQTNSILLDHTKTKKERVVHYSNYTAKHLYEYLLLLDSNHNHLLRNSRTKSPMNYLGVLRVLQKIKYDLKLEQFSSHMIRHSYGTLAYKRKVSELFTNHTMGHARMDMTRRYTHYNIEVDSEIYQELAPMEYYINKKQA
ncbi:MAG: Tyrosine recombinase XerC [Candidatus Izimaplasma bacterium HR2]|nr:MAG: Tyrosine recombinase XerC [Candidatus Izimaplasma bacterium HR2]